MAKPNFADKTIWTVGNLQLLCGARNSVKGDKPQEHLLARLSKRAA